MQIRHSSLEGYSKMPVSHRPFPGFSSQYYSKFSALPYHVSLPVHVTNIVEIIVVHIFCFILSVVGS